MAADRDFIEYVTEQVGLGSRVTSKKMFGEYAFYLDDKVVALACDNSLFVKPSAVATAFAPGLPQLPPFPGAKDYPVADELLDDTEALRRFFTKTAALMPAPKPVKPRKVKRAGQAKKQNGSAP